MNQEERVKEFMRLMTDATNKTGITYAVEHGQNIVLFDVRSNEPLELEITVGTEVKKTNGQMQITTFDKSNIQE
ncbi:hypothetical protein SAMN02745217_02595 [Anaerocolumna xylanovorans DSM 12503]|uniref:Uncharacterized protein n=2 Tax=Anaerocolumna TaxID=1843210 RepID=A0A1M7YC04_9FIRM|nr:hypothetical protein SAMN02745217_02595 [Anaerocolumna xylanovorans DSM 12503]